MAKMNVKQILELIPDDFINELERETYSNLIVNTKKLKKYFRTLVIIAGARIGDNKAKIKTGKIFFFAFSLKKL